MNRPELLAANGRSYARAWTDFIRQFNRDPGLLYCFFEGFDDSKYYNPRIKALVFRNSDLQAVTVWCLGKSNVLKLYELISSNSIYSEAWIAFFIDRDFDLEEIPNDARIYITPCYSIENLYAHPKCVEQVLLDEFQLARDEDEYTRTVELYASRLEEFHNAIEELNAWLYLQKDFEITAAISTGIHTSDLNLERLVTVSISSVVKRYSISDLEKMFPDAPAFSKSEVERRIVEFQSMDRTMAIRGKFLLFFLSKLLRGLSEDRRRRKDRIHFKERIPIQLNLSENILSELTQYAFTPHCLISFLESIRSRKSLQGNLGLVDPEQS